MTCCGLEEEELVSVLSYEDVQDGVLCLLSDDSDDCGVSMIYVTSGCSCSDNRSGLNGQV